MQLLHLLLMAPPQGGEKGGSAQFFIMIILFGVIFYFFFIRPQMKRAKEQKKFREALKKGDKVITIGGMHGRITEIADTTFIVEVESGARIKIEKSAVAMDANSMLNEENKQA